METNYAKKRYLENQSYKENKKAVLYIPSQKIKLLEKYNESLKLINDQERELEEKIKNYEEKTFKIKGIKNV